MRPVPFLLWNTAGSSAKSESGAIRKGSAPVDNGRPYAFDLKFLALAYVFEGVIDVCSLCGAWWFANLYGGGDAQTVRLMMLAPILYAVAEFGRVPLAIALRTQRSIVLRIVLCLGLIASAGITVKQVSLLGQLWAWPRLIAVVHAQQEVTKAKSDVSSLTRRIEHADEDEGVAEANLKRVDDRLSDVARQLAGLPKSQCSPTSGHTRDGGFWRNVRCIPDPRGPSLQEALARTTADRVSAARAVDQARGTRAGLDRTTVDAKLRDAEGRLSEALLHSQFHSFAAMVFGKSPADVSDGEIYLFLRLFVFGPALCVAFISSLIAMASVRRIEPEALADPEITAQTEEYVRSLLADAVVRSGLPWRRDEETKQQAA